MTSLALNVDPTGHHVDKGARRIALIEACGIIPMWIVESPDSAAPLKPLLTASYGFGDLYESEKATVDNKGVMHYPGDPDSYPLMRIERDTEVFYQYQYAMVAIVNKETGDTFVTRMD